MKSKIMNNRGSALIIALIVLVVLAFIASTSIMNSVTNIKIGANYSQTIGVFNLAEQGIEKAKLIAMTVSNFDDLLDEDNYPDGFIIPQSQDDNGTYNVIVSNNITGLNPDSGGATNDTDGIVVLTSTAIGKKGNRVQIETYIGRPTSVTFPEVPGSPGSGGGGAVGACGVGNNIKAWGAGNIRGEDYDLTGTPVSPATGTYGIVLENAGTIVDKKVGSITGFLGDSNVNPSLPCTEWENLSNQLASLGEGPNVEIVTTDKFSGSGTWGTQANPQVTIISTTASEFIITGTVTGAGILVVTGATDLVVTGNMTYFGVILIMGGDAYIKSQGNMDHYGYVMLNNTTPDSDWELEMSGSGFMAFSSAGMALAQEAINGTAGVGGGGTLGSELVTYSWAEKY